MTTISFSTYDEASKVYDALKIVSENDELLQENWNKISKKSLDELKKQFKKKTPRGKTAYQMYSTSKDIIDKLTEGKTLSIGERSKLISNAWKELSKEEQDSYSEKALEYNKQNNLGSVNKPKKPKTPYNCYIASKELRKQINDENGGKLSMIQINKIMSDNWKGLSEEEKQIYVNLAEQSKDSTSETQTSLLESTTIEPLPSETLPSETLPSEPDTSITEDLSKKKKKKKPTSKK